jgi:hypothetical protein
VAFKEEGPASQQGNKMAYTLPIGTIKAFFMWADLICRMCEGFWFGFGSQMVTQTKLSKRKKIKKKGGG